MNTCKDVCNYRIRIQESQRLIGVNKTSGQRLNQFLVIGNVAPSSYLLMRRIR